MNTTLEDVYSQKILTRGTLYDYSSVPADRKNISKFIETKHYKHKHNMYNISPDGTDGLNFMFTKYQKTNHLHSNVNVVGDRVFNSCIYANSEEGDVGCDSSNQKLFSDYIKKNQKDNYSILKFADANMDDKKFGNMFYKE
jgi:hypothetical protein